MLNKVILMGRLTRDPEIRYTPNNQTAVCTFSLAVQRNYAKPGEDRQVDFINITAFSRTAEHVSKYFRKGQLVAIEGRIQTRSWDDTDGKRRYATDIIAEQTYFAEGKKDGQSYNDGFAPSPAPEGDFIPSYTDDVDLPF